MMFEVPINELRKTNLQPYSNHIKCNVFCFLVGPKVGLIIGMVVLGLVIATVIGFGTIFLYRR